MGCFLSKRDFFGEFSCTFGTYKNKPAFFTLPPFVPDIYPTRVRLDSASSVLYMTSCADMLDKMAKYTKVEHDDPDINYTISHFGYTKFDRSVQYLAPASAARSSSRDIVGNASLSALWSSFTDTAAVSAYHYVYSSNVAPAIAKTLLKRFEPVANLQAWPKTRLPVILNSNYLLEPVGAGESALLHYRTNRIGVYEHASKAVRVFKGPASEIHRKKIKELMKDVNGSATI